MSDVAIAKRALALLDLTDLAEDSSTASVQALCQRAVGGPAPVAAICIWPRFISAAKEALGTWSMRIATVANFPAGGTDVVAVTDETQAALGAGADEIDLVLPWRAFLVGDDAAADAMVRAVREACGGKTLKVILETGEYPDLDRVRAASELAIAAGADFIKTSTGKTANSASLAAARTMLEVIAAAGRPVGLKPSGGIRTLADAAAYLALADEIMGPGWAKPEAFRFGASGLHQVLVDVIAGGAAGRASGPY
ncbi:deoxyribose-phosphate aldolase [Bosea sp. AAP35]|uniref:deoxyribose-phosphate aldolase n=1 Tax=Bosea sp. AAP35 TaxID=1523417 RepID=UPI0006B93689|nr:deoxyribose-phosphate aldolase [Bosea sp. AAP35]KPF70652.1 deoxyribose-phosphate aldolase [Bosea sp. AAP35]